MSKIYVDLQRGNDYLGDGSSGNPYQTLNFVMTFAGSGDEVLVENPDGAITFKDKTISLIGVTDFVLRFLTDDTSIFSNAVWEPEEIDEESTIYLENCSSVKIIGANFSSSKKPGVSHVSAIKAVSCSGLTVSDCNIDSSWLVDNPPEGLSGKLFYMDTCTATLSSITATAVNNSYNADLSFIYLSGNGNYSVYSCAFKNLTGNNYGLNGIKVTSNVRNLLIDGYLAYRFTSDIDGEATGIFLEGSKDSDLTYTLNSCQFAYVHTGLRITGFSTSGSAERRIKHSTFYNCHTGVVANNSVADVYSCAIHSSKKTYSHEYPPGTTLTKKTIGVSSENISGVTCMNTIVTGCGAAFSASDNGNVYVSHVIWNDCDAFNNEATSGTVQIVEYVRRTDPLYEDINASKWGYFVIQPTSPCIDTGKNYGDSYLGSAPDIGAFERSREFQEADLASVLSNAARNALYIPMTDIDVEGMIVQGLNTADPDMKAGREGSALRDISVKPMVGLLNKFVTELEYIRRNMSFTNLENMSEDAADALAANLFVTRQKGSVATGVIRFLYEEPVDSTIPAELEFTDASGLKFYTTVATIISKEEMSINIDDGLYYADVIAEAAEEGAGYNVEAGTVTRCTMTLPDGVVAVTNPSAFEGGDVAESNISLYQRIKMAITTRDLVTKRSIAYVLTDKFKNINDITSIGFGDEEMLRDTVLGYHIGGKVDTYVELKEFSKDVMIIRNVEAETPITASTWGNIPLMKILSIEILDKETEDSTGIFIPDNKWRLEVGTANTRFSVYENTTLILDDSYAGYTVQVTYLWADGISDIQDFTMEDDNRVLCTDIMVKHYEPAFVSFAFGYYASSEIASMTSLMELFIRDIANGEALKESKVIEYIHSLGATHVVNPFNMTVEWHKVDGTVQTLNSEDIIEIGGIACFVPLDITVTYLGTSAADSNGSY